MKRHIFTALFFLALFLLLLASFSLNWTGDNFGGVGFDEIMFHLNMPLKGTGQSFIESYIKKALLPAVGIVIELLIGIALAKAFLGANAKEKLAKVRKYSVVTGVAIIVIWAGAVSFRAQRWFGLFDYVKSIVQKFEFIEDEYISPKNVNSGDLFLPRFL